MPITYVVDSLENRTSRIDAHYFDPRYYATISELKSLSDKLGLEITKLNSLLDEDSKTCLTGGATPLGAAYVSEGVKFIRVQNVQPNKLELKDVVFIDYATHQTLLKRSQLKPNDIILTITGTYGNACVVPQDIGDANINQHCVKMEVDKTKISPYYLSCFLNSTLGKRQIDRAVTGSSRPALDYPSIRALFVVYPKDVAMQDNLVRPIQEIDSQITKLRSDATTLDATVKQKLEEQLLALATN
jgi:type I restriction enzyme, S subunit